MLDHARTPALTSVAGPRPAGGVHPSGSVRPGPGGPARPVPGPSGVQSPGFIVRDPASGRLVSTPSVRTHPSGSPSGGGGLGQADAARQPAPRERAQVPVGGRVVERLGRRPSRPGRRRRRRGHPWSAGRSVADPGRVGCGRRPRLTLASRPGQAGVRSARRRRLREGTGGGRTGREAAVLGMGWATTVRGGRGACRPRGRARRGRWACRRDVSSPGTRATGWLR